MTEFDGKVVVIMGASRGIGAATARAFAEAGAKVVLAARSSGDIDALAAEIGEGQALALPCDVSDHAQVAQVIARAVDHFGRLDILVNNAAVVQPIGHLDTLDPAEYGRAVDINTKGVFNAMHAALPVMLAQGGGTILNTSTGAANAPVEGWTAYCSSKAAAKMLTAMADKEYRDRGIRVLGLSPGTVATEMQREIKASGINPVSQLDWSDHIPPEWPARALLWMCGPEADGWLGTDVSLRDEDIRRRVGLI